jgi:SNF2 family DNA or RNA helicase
MESVWLWSKRHKEICRLIETEAVWGHTFHTVWLPRAGTVMKVSCHEVVPLDESCVFANPSYLTYVASAARVSDSMQQDVLLSPLEASVIPLPHQIKALSRALSGNRIRYLLADEVGLGKTIEAGLIMREMKIRGLANRVLIVVPRGLVPQWIGEMKLRFNEEFKLVLPDDIETVKKLFSNHRHFLNNKGRHSLPHLGELSETGAKQGPANPFRMFNQVICPLDSFKPVEKRKGWTQVDVDAYNQARYQNLIGAGWDLIIIDEAHRLGGSTEQVARHKLGRGLAEAAPYLLLLSATPHQGKSDAFVRLMSLLDPEQFTGEESASKEKVRPYVIRTEKRKAIDLDGLPLFKPRHTQLMPIAWGKRHNLQEELYQAVSCYVREGYNQALREKRNYIGFLLLLMQRLVTSSTRAIRDTLEKRLQVLEDPCDDADTVGRPVMDDEWAELDGQVQLESLMAHSMAALRNEEAEVRGLLALATKAEISSTDAKTEALLDLIYRLQQEEMDPDLKFLIFTEFVSTQTMLQEFLSERGFSVACLNGSMSMDQRILTQREFANDAQFLVSTDAGGEGLNLQFCHVVVNYDIPWNPMKLEQRIGRVDRIGQERVVKAVNFVLQDTVEGRVQEVIEEKLSVILNEFGVDKTQDVLDSAQAGSLFDSAYREVILRPDSAPERIEDLIRQVKDEIQASRYGFSLIESSRDLDPTEAKRVYENPVQHWVEQMVTSYLCAYGGKAVKKLDSWDLTWPDGEIMNDVVFLAPDAHANPKTRYLTMEDVRVRSIAMNLARFVPGQPIPKVLLPDLAEGLAGYWSLWKIGVKGQVFDQYKVMPHFITREGRILVPTARFVWNKLVAGQGEFIPEISGSQAQEVFSGIEESAVEEGKKVFDELASLYKQRIRQETEKGAYAFDVRRKAIERLGLESVRVHRLGQLENEISEWQRQMKEKSRFSPDIIPLIVAVVE